MKINVIRVVYMLRKHTNTNKHNCLTDAVYEYVVYNTTGYNTKYIFKQKSCFGEVDT